MQQLDHPHLVRYTGHDFSDTGTIRLYMELFLRTLHSEIREREPAKRLFMMDELLHIALGICSGLEYLHTLICPIVHRDLSTFFCCWWCFGAVAIEWCGHF